MPEYHHRVISVLQLPILINKEHFVIRNFFILPKRHLNFIPKSLLQKTMRRQTPLQISCSTSVNKGKGILQLNLYEQRILKCRAICMHLHIFCNIAIHCNSVQSKSVICSRKVGEFRFVCCRRWDWWQQWTGVLVKSKTLVMVKFNTLSYSSGNDKI